MLSPHTLTHLAAFTCPRCGQPLGRFHVYLLTDPVEVLRQTTEGGPMHLECAHEQAEVDHRAQIRADPTFARPLCYALYVVKATPSDPSARIIRLHREVPATRCLHLFSPEKITFFLQTLNGPQAIVREASFAEIEAVMQPAAQKAGEGAAAEEQQEIIRQIRRLHKFFPKRPQPSQPAS
jgi:hypothetical protein